MSGGSMDYLHQKVEDGANQFKLSSPLRLALRSHMLLLSRALRAVEWNDSGDGDDEEEKLLRELLQPDLPIYAAIAGARAALHDLQEELRIAEARK